MIIVIPTAHLYGAVCMWVEAIALFQTLFFGLILYLVLCGATNWLLACGLGKSGQSHSFSQLSFTGTSPLATSSEPSSTSHSHERQNTVFRVWMKLKVPLNTGVQEWDLRRFKCSTNVQTFQQAFIQILEKAQNYSKARADKVVKDLTESKIRHSNKVINNCNNLKCTLTLQGNIIF